MSAPLDVQLNVDFVPRSLHLSPDRDDTPEREGRSRMLRQPSALADCIKRCLYFAVREALTDKL